MLLLPLDLMFTAHRLNTAGRLSGSSTNETDVMNVTFITVI